MSFIDRMNSQYFDGRLSQNVLTLLEPVNGERPDVRGFVERMCRLMRRQGLDARDFPEFLAWVVSMFIPKMLPNAWGGAVPPITQQGRHADIDEYLAKNPWRRIGDGERLLDLGCGFPPMTALDTANRFPGVDLTAADPSFGRYLVREANGDYAVFDGDAQLIYFQPATNEAESWQALYADPIETRRRFGSRLSDLRALLPDDVSVFSSVSRDGAELTQNPVLEFGRDNLTFRQVGIGSSELRGFHAVRCFNVLLYFDDAFNRDAIEWLGNVVVDGGISISGIDWSHSRFARYSVHRAEDGVMRHKEFAFSIENLRPFEIMPFFTLHEDDRGAELLASLVGVVRDDDGFRQDFDRRLDELLSETRFCERKADGYLGTLSEGADPRTFATASKTIGSALEHEGFNQRAVDALNERGYRAWVNCVGHVAIDPEQMPS
jgi:hypothetical protein